MPAPSDAWSSPFSWRYGSPEMRSLWGERQKHLLWRRVWVALAEAQAELGLVDEDQVADLRAHAHDVDLERAAAIEADLRKLSSGRTFWITVSRRTPEAIRNRFRSLAGELGAVFWENEQRDGPNPYVAFLSLCDAALVTEDSANMLADPAFFAKPIHIMKLEGASPRFDRLHQGFIAAGAARWFDGDIQTWSYQPIREAARAADEIVRLLLQRHPNR